MSDTSRVQVIDLNGPYLCDCKGCEQATIGPHLRIIDRHWDLIVCPAHAAEMLERLRKPGAGEAT